MRDAFAVLFFVSVGMLFDPGIIMREPGSVLATFLIIVGGNALAAFLIVLALRRSLFTALTSAASLSQIGEFSFILAGLGVALQLLPENGRALILAGAILSILANPLLFFALDKARPWLGERNRRTQPTAVVESGTREEQPITSLKDHAVIVGCGRVGTLGGRGYGNHTPTVFGNRSEIVDKLRARGVEVISGNAAQSGFLRPQTWPVPGGSSAQSRTLSKTAISSSRHVRQTPISRS